MQKFTVPGSKPTTHHSSNNTESLAARPPENSLFFFFFLNTKAGQEDREGSMGIGCKGDGPLLQVR